MVYLANERKSLTEGNSNKVSKIILTPTIRFKLQTYKDI